ncbi:MAG: ankyrin repeat domain-containing protein [Spirulinaceae cyanobacterium]
MKKSIDTTEFVLKTFIRIILLGAILSSGINGFLSDESWLRWQALFISLIGLPLGYLWLEILFRSFPGKKPLVIISIILSFGLTLLVGSTLQPEKNFIDAAEAGKIETVSEYLKKGGNPNERINSITALHYAAVKGNYEIVALLIENGADVNARSNESSTPLHWAMQSRNPETITLLIEKGADFEAVDQRGTTPLYWAAAHGAKEATLILLAKGANVNAEDKNESTALHAAARLGRTDIVKLLIENGAEVNARMTSGETPLNMALKENHQQTANLLKSYGAKE